MERTGPVFDFGETSDDSEDTTPEKSKDKRSKKQKAAPVLGKSLFEHAFREPQSTEKPTATLADIFEKNRIDAAKKETLEKPFQAIESATEPSQESLPDSEEVLVAPEVLTGDELNQVARNLVEAKQAALEEEQMGLEGDTPEAAESQGAARLMDTIKDKLAEGQAPSEELLDAATDEAILELDLEPADEIESDEQEPSVEEVEEATGAEDVEEDEQAPVSTPPPVAPSGPGGGSTPTPPSPPTPPPPPSAGGGAAGSIPPVGGMGSGGFTPPPAAFNVQPQAPSPRIDLDPSHNRRKDLLVGGIVGYLLGRRRGRIKTEARMKPIQESLEKQVKALDYQLEARELKIRKLVAEKQAAQTASTKEAVSQTAQEHNEHKIKPKEAVPKSQEAASKPPVEVTPSVEKLARVVVPQPEMIAPKRYEQNAEPEKRQKILTRQEYIQAARTLDIRGKNVYEAYAKGRIDERTLVEVVAAFMRGDNRFEQPFIEKLRPEFEEQQKSPEARNKFEVLDRQSTQDDQQSKQKIVADLPQVVGVAQGDESAGYTRNQQLDATAYQEHAPKSQKRTAMMAGAAAGVGLLLLLVLFLLLLS